MKKKGYKTLSEADFTTIKTLLDNKVSYLAIKRITGRAASTVKRIDQTSSLKEYKDLTRKWNLEMAKKRELHSAPTMSTSEVNEHTTTIVPETSELTRIALALERLADAWEASPKRRLF